MKNELIKNLMNTIETLYNIHNTDQDIIKLLYKVNDEQKETISELKDKIKELKK